MEKLWSKLNLTKLVPEWLLIAFLSWLLANGNYWHPLKLKAIRSLNTMDIGIFIGSIALLPILAGMLVAFPRFISKWRKPGSWHFQWVPFLLIGIPTLYYALKPFFYGIAMFIPQLSWLFTGRTSDLVFTAAGVVFGYMLLASFRKEE